MEASPEGSAEDHDESPEELESNLLAAGEKGSGGLAEAVLDSAGAAG